MTPYKTLAPKHFWAPAVGQKSMFDISDLWQPKLSISQSSGVVTFGSCFAQYFSKALTEHGFRWLNMEPGPDLLTDEDRKEFNFGVFSARTGNIYTPSLLLQWLRWACGKDDAPNEAWVQGDRVFDPFRPKIEPDGFASLPEMQRSRAMCLKALHNCVTKADVFVFTLGLTESWFHGEDRAYEYPMCPGTVAGTFDPDKHIFVNQTFRETTRALNSALRLMRKINPSIQVLLTVSPVPLTATASGEHVLVASMKSKSILRAAADHVAEQKPWVDYFPSYEIISSPPFRGSFFEPNMRSVNPHGVAHVMKTFFAGLGHEAKDVAPQEPTSLSAPSDPVCEEVLLDAQRASNE